MNVLRTPGRKGQLRLVLSLVCVVLVLLACGATPIVNRLAKAPASTINLTVVIDDQLAFTSEKTTVLVSAGFSNKRESFVLSGKQLLTCDGVRVPNMSGVPRRNAGVYTFVYTDEQGHQTTLLVPVPKGVLDMTFPPGGGGPVALPTTAQDAALVESTPGPRPPALASAFIIHYHFPLLPPTATGTVSAYVTSEFGTSKYDEVTGAVEAATGTYVLSDAGTPLGQGFDGFAPGPGVLMMSAQAHWATTTSGFHRVDVTYRGEVSIPLTWTSA